jgi:hypothetical protein
MLVQQNRQWMMYTLGMLILILTGPAWAGGFSGGVRDGLGPRFDAAPSLPAAPRLQDTWRGAEARSRLRYWNEIAVNTSGIDHTPLVSGENRVFGEQYGPTRASRAMAIVHVAIFEAVNAIVSGYQSYLDLPLAPDDTSIDAAMAQAAHDTLVALFPSQGADLDDLLAEDLSQIVDGRAKTNGMTLGQRAAAVMLARRAVDGSQHEEPRVGVDCITSDEPGKWRQDSVSQLPLALGAYWSGVTPFVLRSSDQDFPDR